MKLHWLYLLATLSASVKAQATDGESLVPMKTHGLHMPYIDQDLQNRWYDIGGDAIINANKHIALTLDRPSQTGRIWSKLPVTGENWQIEFEFKVGDEKSTKKLHGDGLAFWLTKERNEEGPVFGNKDKWDGLGIVFDTYPNGRHEHSFPFVMAMRGDGRTSYDSQNDGKSNQIASCEADIRSKSHPTKARVKYYKDQRLELHLQYKDVDKWDVCFVVDKVALPPLPYVGFTALTGDVSDFHAIISVTGSVIKLDKSSTAGRKEQSKTPEVIASWGFIGTMIRLFGFGSVVGVAFIVFRMYQKDAKRF